MQSQVESFFPTLHPKDFPLGVIILDMLWKTGKYILYSYWFLIFTWHSSGILLPSEQVCVSGLLARGWHWHLCLLTIKWFPQDCCRYITLSWKVQSISCWSPRLLAFCFSSTSVLLGRASPDLCPWTSCDLSKARWIWKS